MLFNLAPGLARDTDRNFGRVYRQNKTLTIKGSKMTPKVKKRVDGDELRELIQKHDSIDDDEQILKEEESNEKLRVTNGSADNLDQTASIGDDKS